MTMPVISCRGPLRVRILPFLVLLLVAASAQAAGPLYWDWPAGRGFAEFLRPVRLPQSMPSGAKAAQQSLELLILVRIQAPLPYFVMIVVIDEDPDSGHNLISQIDTSFVLIEQPHDACSF